MKIHLNLGMIRCDSSDFCNFLEKLCFLHDMEQSCNFLGFYGENMVNLITRIAGMGLYGDSMRMILLMHLNFMVSVEIVW